MILQCIMQYICADFMPAFLEWTHDIEVDNKELKTLYKRLNTKINARHLYATSRRQADSLYIELKSGKSFKELAKNIFKDPQLRNTGGSLGYFTLDEMDPAFEDAAFALEIGQISKPIRTAQGYSIIQVHNRMTKPLLTESEYIKHCSKLENYWRYRKRKRATQFYVDSLRQVLEISFNGSVVNQLWRFLKNNKRIVVEESNIWADDLFKNKEIVRSKIGIWDVKTFQKYAAFTSEEQLKWIRSRENLEDYIAGLVVRAYMLSRAEDLGLHKTRDYELKVKQKTEDYLIKRMEQNISEITMVSKDSLQTYFQKNKDQFIIPPKIHLCMILLNDGEKAKNIKYDLMKNKSFEKLANEHSVQRWSADNDGDIGTFTYKDLGSYADRIFPLKVGQWMGPIKIDTQYAFFKCIGKDSKREQIFDEVRSEIERILKPIWQKKTRQNLLENIRKNVKIVTYPEKLKTIKLG